MIKSFKNLRVALFTLLLLLSSMCTSEKYIHPDFTITESMLTQFMEEHSVHPDISKNILANSEKFLKSMKILLHTPPEFLWLIDKKHSLDNSYEPQDLVDLTHYSIKITKHSLNLRQIILPDLLNMIKDAEKEGVRLIIASTYRSYSYQARVYDYWVKTSGQEQADRESAKPGHSQHQLGTTLDFFPIEDTFANTNAGHWVAAHAHEYGFSLSYPEGYEDVTGYKYEPWHYRYMGKEATKVINTYFLGVQQFFCEFFHENADFFKQYLKNEK